MVVLWIGLALIVGVLMGLALSPLLNKKERRLEEIKSKANYRTLGRFKHLDQQHLVMVDLKDSSFPRIYRYKGPLPENNIYVTADLYKDEIVLVPKKGSFHSHSH